MTQLFIDLIENEKRLFFASLEIAELFTARKPCLHPLIWVTVFYFFFISRIVFARNDGWSQRPSLGTPPPPPPPKCLISDLSRFSVNIYRPLLSVQGGLELFFKIDSTTWARWKSSLWSQEGNKKSHSMKIRHEEAVWRSPPPSLFVLFLFFPRRVTSLRDWHRPLFPRLLLEWSTGYFQPRRSPERRPGGLLLLLLFLLLPRLRHFFLVFNLSLFVLPISNGPAKKHGRRPFFNIVAFFLLWRSCFLFALHWTWIDFQSGVSSQPLCDAFINGVDWNGIRYHRAGN